MITVDDVRYLIEMFNDDGMPKEPFIYKCSIDEGTPIYIKEFIYKITSLEGVVFTKGSSMEGLDSLVTLDDVILGDNVTLSGLHSLKTLKGVSLGDNVTLKGLNSIKSLKGVLLPDGTSLSGLDSLEDISYLRTLKDVWIGTGYPGPSYIEGFQMGPGTRISNVSSDSIDGITISEGCFIGANYVRSLPPLFPKGTEFGSLNSLCRITLSQLKRISYLTARDLPGDIEVTLGYISLTDSQKEVIRQIPDDLYRKGNFNPESIMHWIGYNPDSAFSENICDISHNAQVKLLARLKVLC